MRSQNAMKKGADKKALLDKLGVPPGTIDERERWLYGRVADLGIGEEQDPWLLKLNEYSRAITDPDACWRCGDKKAEGYVEKDRFVREEDPLKLRELCDGWPNVESVNSVNSFVKITSSCEQVTCQSQRPKFQTDPLPRPLSPAPRD